jgi:uncharacterized protein YqfB (UPF0267 family)
MKTIIQTHDSNKKLRCDAFSIIRPSDGTYKAGELVSVSLKIYHNGKPDEVHNYGTHRIDSIEELTLDELRDSEARLDTGMSANEVRQLMKRKYPGIEVYDYMILVKVKQHTKQNDNPEPSPSIATTDKITGQIQGGNSQIQPVCSGNL